MILAERDMKISIFDMKTVMNSPNIYCLFLTIPACTIRQSATMRPWEPSLETIHVNSRCIRVVNLRRVYNTATFMVEREVNQASM